jgi:hypothetical protein
MSTRDSCKNKVVKKHTGVINAQFQGRSFRSNVTKDSHDHYERTGGGRLSKLGYGLDGSEKRT